MVAKVVDTWNFIGSRGRKYSSKQLFAIYVVNLDAAVNHKYVKRMSCFIKVVQAANSFYFWLIRSQSSISALYGTDL